MGATRLTFPVGGLRLSVMASLPLSRFQPQYVFLSHFPFSKHWASFTTLDLAEREEHCSHLSQNLAQSLDQVELIGLVRCCFAMAREVKQLTGMHWSWCLHQ